MSELRARDTLKEWRQSAEYWETHAETIQTMFAPVTQALIEEAGIIDGAAVLDVAGEPGDPSLTSYRAISRPHRWILMRQVRFVSPSGANWQDV